MVPSSGETVRFGRYEVVRWIAEGGMARVYLAVQRGAGGFEKRVVLKLLHPKLHHSREALDMFLEEARVMARLRHPNIVDVFEVDSVGGLPFIALEYVTGPTLGRLYRHVGRPGPETIGPFVNLLRQVCDALHYAHTLRIDGRPAGLVHRDVSSQNVLVEASTGVAKLIDFGIAKAQDADRDTQFGVLKGRLHYIAPEVLGGARPDARADLYAIGVMLHRMLYGRMPYRDADLTIRRIAVSTEPVPGIPPELSAIVARALNPDPDQRHASAEELAADLGRVELRLGAERDRVVRLVARVFPRGEADWLGADPVELPPAEPPPSRLGLYAGLAAAMILFVSASALAAFVLAEIAGRMLAP